MTNEEKVESLRLLAFSGVTVAREYAEKTERK